jgi:hypothetical protein
METRAWVCPDEVEAKIGGKSYRLAVDTAGRVAVDDVHRVRTKDRPVAAKKAALEVEESDPLLGWWNATEHAFVKIGHRDEVAEDNDVFDAVTGRDGNALGTVQVSNEAFAPVFGRPLADDDEPIPANEPNSREADSRPELELSGMRRDDEEPGGPLEYTDPRPVSAHVKVDRDAEVWLHRHNVLVHVFVRLTADASPAALAASESTPTIMPDKRRTYN